MWPKYFSVYCKGLITEQHDFPKSCDIGYWDCWSCACQLVRWDFIHYQLIPNKLYLSVQFEAFDFRTTTRNEPFLQLFHCLYVYPSTVSMSRKRNVFIRVELRKDDIDFRKPPLEVCISFFQSSSYKFHVVGSLSDCLSLGYASKGTRCTTSEMVSHTSCCWGKGGQLPWWDQSFFASYLDTITSPFVYFLSCWSSDKTWSTKAGKLASML